MINKYKKQIGLSIFTSIIVISFLILVIQDHNTKNITIEKNNETTTTSQIETTTNIGIETTAPTEETTNFTQQTLKRNRKKFQHKLPFRIKVNRAENFVTVYTLDENGKYTIPYKTFWCSTGADIDSTPLGKFEMTERYDWRIMVDGTYAQYAIRIHGPIMLHSVPYTTSEYDALEYWEYNKLGKPASLGCVRLQAGDIKWIYDNCDNGTKVTIYDRPNENPPINIPKIKKIKKGNKNKGWDPTDTHEGNPWHKEATKKNIRK